MTLYRKNLAVRKSENHTYVACLTFPLQPLDDLNIFCDHATFLPQDDNQNFLSPWHSACMIQPGPQVACCDPPRWPSWPPTGHAAGATPSPPSSASSPGRLSILNRLLQYIFESTAQDNLTVLSPRVAPAKRARCSFSNREFSSLKMVKTIFFFGFCSWLSPDGRMMEWWANVTDFSFTTGQLIGWRSEACSFIG